MNQTLNVVADVASLLVVFGLLLAFVRLYQRVSNKGGVRTNKPSAPTNSLLRAAARGLGKGVAKIQVLFRRKRRG